MSYPTRSPWTLLAGLLGGFGAVYALLTAWYVLGVMAAHHTDATDRTLLGCDSPAEARAAGTLLDTALVTPRTVRYGAYTLTFTAGWVEQLRTSHRPAWYARPVIRPSSEVWLRLRYRVRRHGPPPTSTLDVPYLASCCTGGVPIDQREFIDIAAERLRPDYYHLPDSLKLALVDGAGNRPPQVFRVVLPRQGFIR